MADFFALMFKPFLACLILAGIHAYLGMHVVQRGVIFVDLALAQLAAFGMTVGFIFGFHLHSGLNYMCALGVALIGAAIFSLTRFREGVQNPFPETLTSGNGGRGLPFLRSSISSLPFSLRRKKGRPPPPYEVFQRFLRKQIVPQEALIGIVYAVAAAASILALSRAPQGGEELKALMVGHLLFVSWAEIATIAVIYTALGLVLWFCRKPLMLISQDAQAAFAGGIRVRAWDFVFYAIFGAIVTSSTELAGVLLVFSFLVVPAVCGMLLAESVRARLMVGWVCGLITSVLGIYCSYYFDLPTGAAVVCMFGACLAVCWGVIRPLRLYRFG